MPETIAPTALLLDRHLGTPVEHKAAVIVDGEPVSYGELAERVAAVSAGLAAHGVVPEDRILLFGTDSLDYVTMWLGAVRIGAVPAVVSDLYKAPDLLYFLCDTAARFLFIDAEQLPKLAEIAAELPASLEMIFVRGGDASHAARSRAGSVIPFDADRRFRRARRRRRVRAIRNDVAYMFFSGGTTGTAKGITHLAHDFVLVPAAPRPVLGISRERRRVRDVEEILHPRPVAGPADPALLRRDRGADPPAAGAGLVSSRRWPRPR